MIHLFEKKGTYLVLDVNSGALHILTKLAYDVLSVCGDPMPDEPSEAVKALGHPEDETNEVYSELLSLRDQGLLFAPEIKVPFPDIKYVPVKAMCLHIAHDCNMRCKYC
ncbi:MAG TPA: thioether cross-link-forming SCIFF peptide maturase, partial [Bacillota bacterium]|nr:thioether cross-link-forming SCIFF peptide maturase [Bacillota bacterium]